MSSSSSTVSHISQAFNFAIPSSDYVALKEGNKITIGVSTGSPKPVYFQSLGTDMKTTRSGTGFAIYAGSYSSGVMLPVPITVINVTSQTITMQFGKPNTANFNQGNNPFINIELFLWAPLNVDYFSLYSSGDVGEVIQWNYGHGQAGGTNQILNTDSGNSIGIPWTPTT